MAEKHVTASRYWMNVASLDHVEKGIEWGIIQSCHGKPGPIKRMHKGDWVIHYSPKEAFGGKTPCQKFTSIGQVADEDIYQYDMGDGFLPWRRKVNYLESCHCPISPMLDDLSFTKGKQSWGFVFRYGFFEILESDFRYIFFQMVGIPYIPK